MYPIVYILYFQFLYRNIPAYEVYISQLTRKLLNQGFQVLKLKSSLRQFYGRHHGMVNSYGISVPQMTKDLLRLS